MNKVTFIYALILIISVFISSISQAMLKKSALCEHQTRISEYLNPIVVSAYVLFVISTLMTVIAYRGVPLSLGPVFETTSYVYISVIGVKIFKEQLDARKIISLGIIILGIIIYAFLG